ncbi:group I truncated hemoglobin [Polycladomyces subterraneus]|uniref:Group 1 truncated hemoglobin n=1 Tax=Polycladomyces subterraneus TaxID=1016997 RepID=A0ABT8IMI6_9BACL|nr:group 1 truncated hemoglobin [Polycladomyces subterraneus]MDN4594005.1 group 1 truncated hemoglobin [Polycladomyces subterraneus]
MSGTQTTTLFERLGGEEGIIAIVRTFYDRVLNDPLLQPFFRHTDMKHQRRHQTQFLIYATGGAPRYTGVTMKKAHESISTPSSVTWRKHCAIIMWKRRSSQNSHNDWSLCEGKWWRRGDVGFFRLEHAW